MSVDDDWARVGIRELRDNLKDVLEKVELGATIEVTKNGRTIAMIVPRPSGDATERLIAEGKLLPSRSGSGSVRLPRRVLPSPGSPSSGEALDDMRTERR
ncbi:type II toxin-antitoxin system Phd/YefM family antitoxin [Actinophytocola glycyrrhizae]|uniref:Type II toxin-antitoxin system Phd/YefM family antitoxin n=1 Tax=Actinophytocola glycyrrhizae TaxID=2044873 RepID=A0ABV9RZ92_9PSEU